MYNYAIDMDKAIKYQVGYLIASKPCTVHIANLQTLKLLLVINNEFVNKFIGNYEIEK